MALALMGAASEEKAECPCCEIELVSAVQIYECPDGCGFKGCADCFTVHVHWSDADTTSEYSASTRIKGMA